MGGENGFNVSIVNDIPLSLKKGKGSMYDPLFVDVPPRGQYKVVEWDDSKQCAIKYSIIRGLVTRRGWDDKFVVNKRGKCIYISLK